ncbi:MAG: hypothetical protein ACTS2F_12255 [Thainema sp.]
MFDRLGSNEEAASSSHNDHRFGYELVDVIDLPLFYLRSQFDHHPLQGELGCLCFNA